MNERVLQFGETDGLAGVLAEPSGPAQGTGAVAQGGATRTGVLLLNAGIIHHIGANRLNVKLARRLAALGYAALRFDLGGIGDSRPSRSSAGFDEQAVRDIQAATDVLMRETGCTRVVTVGICSGADNGYAAALRDPRIAGVVMIDPFPYPSREARLRYLMRNLFDGRRWARQLARLARRGRGPAATAQRPAAAVNDDVPVADNDRVIPPRAEFGENLARLAAGGTGVYLMYTRSSQHLVSSPGQFFRSFGRYRLRGRIAVDVMRDMDHTCTEVAMQEVLLGRVCDWIRGGAFSNK